MVEKLMSLELYICIRRLINVLLCSIPLLTLISCGTVHTSGQRSAATQKSDHSLPATQRPYVINSKKYYPIPSADGYSERGIASWYGGKFHGRRTSNGEIYNMHSMTAAHKTLPMNTMLLIHNLDNGRETIVRINDRGPFVRGRIVDLSYKAAQTLGIIKNGTARVQVIALGEEAVNKGGKAPTLVYQNLSLGEFYVQIGAFADKANALKLQKRFNDSGHTTVIQKGEDVEPNLYRVKVYVGRTMNDAKRAEKALVERGYIDAFVIAR
jgi:rare lipoprotein A